jgi:hypothetical protein
LSTSAGRPRPERVEEEIPGGVEIDAAGQAAANVKFPPPIRDHVLLVVGEEKQLVLVEAGRKPHQALGRPADDDDVAVEGLGVFGRFAEGDVVEEALVGIGPARAVAVGVVERVAPVAGRGGAVDVAAARGEQERRRGEIIVPAHTL